jgi:hypothetical protein
MLVTTHNKKALIDAHLGEQSVSRLWLKLKIELTAHNVDGASHQANCEQEYQDHKHIFIDAVL